MPSPGLSLDRNIHFDHDQLMSKPCNRLGFTVPILDMTSPECLPRIFKCKKRYP
jgi:hypothetical protein